MIALVGIAVMVAIIGIVWWMITRDSGEP